MNLREWQLLFRDFIQDKSSVKFEAAPLENLNIYKKHYFNKLIHQLEKKFPKAIAYCNRKSLYQFVTGNPVLSSNLDDYGGSFPRFLQFDLKMLQAAEIANLEFLLDRAQNYPEEKSVDIKKLKELNLFEIADVYFTFKVSISLAKISIKSYQLFNLIDDFQEAMGRSEAFLIIYKARKGSAQIVISYEEFMFIDLLSKGSSFKSALTTIVTDVSNKFNPTQILKSCFRLGLITNIRF